MNFVSIVRVAAAGLIVSVSLAGCGGGGGGGTSTGGGSSAPIIPAASTATLTGTVLDTSTNQPLAGVLVSVASTSLSATTNSVGVFSIPNVPDGAQVLSLTLSGSNLATDDVTVTGSADAVPTIDVTDSMGAPGPPPL